MAYAYAEQSIWSGRRLVALLVAIGVNLGMILAISNGLDFDFVKEEPVLQVVDVPPTTEPEQTIIDIPVPTEVQQTPVQIEVPPLVVDIQVEAPAEPVVTATTQPQPTPAITQPASTQLQAETALAAPVYPPAAIRGNQEGTVTLLIYVLPDGRVGDVRIAKSSGFPLLDQAAMKAARGGWRFKAATQGGAAVAAWGRYAVAFNLRDAQG